MTHTSAPDIEFTVIITDAIEMFVEEEWKELYKL
jgi:hypothetical protein